MAEDKKYNGWTNYETWLCNLWYDNAFTEDARRCRTLENLAEVIKDYVTQSIEEQVGEEAGFVTDLVNAALSEIDWLDIAERYEEDLAKEVEEEEE